MTTKLRALLALFATVLMTGGSLTIMTNANATGGGNEGCPPGTTLVAKANWNGSGYVFEGPANGVTITGDATTANFTSATPIAAVVVKGGTNAKIDRYDPPVTSGSFSRTGLVNNGGQTSDVSNVQFCGPDRPAQPDDKVTYTEWKDGDKSCESKTVTQTRSKTVTPYKWDGSAWVLDTANAVTTTETQTRPMTEAELKECAGSQPDDKVTYTEWKDGDKSCESKTVTQTRSKTVTPYKWDGSAWVLDTANAVTTTETQTRPMTAEELKACEGTPPPDDSCPPLTGSVKTTLPDGSAVNGNIYTSKSDVYVYGDQLGDVTTVYIRVTDPSGATVLSDVKQVSVTDGSFGPVQLPAFADTPNNGGEYKVWVSSSTDFEHSCTKTDNFKVKGEEPPPPTPEPGTATAASGVCVNPGESTGVVTVTVTNTDDATDQSVTYTVKVGDVSKTITLPDGQSGSVQFTGLAPGDYSWSVTGPDGTKVSDTVKVKACDVPPPTPANPTVSAAAKACVNKGEATGVVTVTVTNTDDATNDEVTYDVTLNGVTKQVTIADGQSGSVEFTGLGVGSYPVTVKGDDKTTASTSAKVEECTVTSTPTPTPTVTPTVPVTPTPTTPTETPTPTTPTETPTPEIGTPTSTSVPSSNPTPTSTPTFVPPNTGGGEWPPSGFVGSQDNSFASLIGKVMLLGGMALMLVVFFAPRRRKVIG